MSARLAGKTALVTGSTAGCGAAIARRFAREGAKVVVTGRSEERGRAIVAEIEAAGGVARFLAADLSIEEWAETLVAGTVEAFGGLDILVNNASPTELQRGPSRIDAPVTRLATADMESLWRGALYSYFWMCRYSLSAMIAGKRGGSVVNISSTVSIAGVEGADAYTAAKGAINATTRSMAVEYAPHGIRVNAILLGLIITSDVAERLIEDEEAGATLRERHLTRHGRPEDIAAAALFLASDEAAFITGSELRADGGVTINSRFPAARMHGRTAT
ncbi:MAG: SDR family oxidoreductase [Sphingomonadaceae bacterium]|nr:SDR family oxidoreductase [Sphingomonadaceae bacterium]